MKGCTSPVEKNPFKYSPQVLNKLGSLVKPHAKSLQPIALECLQLLLKIIKSLYIHLIGSITLQELNSLFENLSHCILIPEKLSPQMDIPKQEYLNGMN